MLWWSKIILLLLGATGASWLLTGAVRQLALRFQVLDQPNGERKIHSQPTPLLGGWAIYLSVLILTLLLWFGGRVSDPKVSPGLLVGFFISGAILMLGGWLDDKWKLAWYQSLAFTFSAALVVIIAGLQMPFVSNPLGGLLYFDQWEFMLLGSIVSIAGILAFFWLLITIYTTKLLDGLDGLAGSISLIASLVIFVVSLFWDTPNSFTSYLSIIVAGSIIGFLFWNWHPAKIFLGESGSTFLGFTLGFLAIVTGGKIATALLVMGLPMLDVVWAIVRRIMKRRSIAIGDAGHLHFRLLRLGWSQQRVVITMSIIALLFGSVSFFATTKGKVGALAILIILMLGAVIYFVQHERENH